MFGSSFLPFALAEGVPQVFIWVCWDENGASVASLREEVEGIFRGAVGGDEGRRPLVVGRGWVVRVEMRVYLFGSVGDVVLGGE